MFVRWTNKDRYIYIYRWDRGKWGKGEIKMATRKARRGGEKGKLRGQRYVGRRGGCIQGVGNNRDENISSCCKTNVFVGMVLRVGVKLNLREKRGKISIQA